MLLVVAVVTAWAADNTPVATLFDTMRSGKYDPNRTYNFPKVGTNDIPELLEHAAHTNQLTCFPINRMSSTIKFSCSEGMVALWLIEGVRIGGTFPSQVPECYDKRKPVPAGALFYAEADQATVTETYTSWWKRQSGQLESVAPLAECSLTWDGGRRLETQRNEPNQAIHPRPTAGQ